MSCNLFTDAKVKTGRDHAARVAAYLVDQAENEELPELVFGDPQDVIRNDRRSELHGHKSSNVHFKLTSRDPLSRDEAMRFVHEIRQVYGIDPETRPDVLAMHRKQRADGKGFDCHYHYVVAYTDTNGKALNTNNTFARNELVSRSVEFALGRDLGKGAHNTQVRKMALERGQFELVAAIDASGITEGKRRKSAYDKDTVESAAKAGVNVAALSVAVKHAKSANDMSAVFEYLKKHDLKLAQGKKKPDVVCVFKTIQDPKTGKPKDVFVGSLSRMLKIKKEAAAQFLDVYSKATGGQNGTQARYDHINIAGARGAAKQRSGTERRTRSGGGLADANNSRGKHGQALAVDRGLASKRLQNLRSRLRGNRAAAGVSSIIPLVAEIRDNNPVIVDIESMDTGTLLKIINEANARNARRKPGLTF